MPQIILGTSHALERFVTYTADTLEQLRQIINVEHEGTATVAQIGQAQDGTWYAVFDRALQVVLTLDDVSGMDDDPTLEVEPDKNPITLSA